MNSIVQNLNYFGFAPTGTWFRVLPSGGVLPFSPHISWENRTMKMWRRRAETSVLGDSCWFILFDLESCSCWKDVMYVSDVTNPDVWLARNSFVWKSLLLTSSHCFFSPISVSVVSHNSNALKFQPVEVFLCVAWILKINLLLFLLFTKERGIIANSEFIYHSKFRSYFRKTCKFRTFCQW